MSAWRTAEWIFKAGRVERPKGVKELDGGSCLLDRTLRDSIRAKGASERTSCEGEPPSLGKKTQPAASQGYV